MAKAKSEKMFWIFPVPNDDGQPVKIFGKPATKNDEGHFVVDVDSDLVENEKSRVCERLLDANEYKTFLKKKGK